MKTILLIVSVLFSGCSKQPIYEYSPRGSIDLIIDGNYKVLVMKVDDKEYILVTSIYTHGLAICPK